jgi:hypothetical protein
VSFDEHLGAVIALSFMGHRNLAVELLDRGLSAAPAGNAGWLIPVEPLLNVSANPDEWRSVLARLRSRAT